MAARPRSPGWRDEAAASLLLRHVPSLSLTGPILVMEEPGKGVAERFGALGMEVTTWNRLALGGRRATAWPPRGPFGAVTLRLPRSKDALAMSLHAGASVLRRGGTLLLYGAKDEGIASATSPLEALFGSVGTVGVGGRCRVLEARKESPGESIRDTLSAWREGWDPEIPGLPGPWISYPGVFAHGGVDSGTRLLLDLLPRIPQGARVLDYGCGSGIVGALARARTPELDLHLLDLDAVALEAARQNVPEGTLHLADGLEAVASARYDVVLSNPPFHRGKDEDVGMLREFVRGARRVLKPGGTLTFVTQRRIALERDLQASFRDVTVLGQDATFKVWHGEGPGPSV